MEPVPPLYPAALERAIEALARDVERRFSERLMRNMNETSDALLADAANLRSPTAIRSLMAAADMLGMSHRRRWRKERRADEDRFHAIWSALHATES